MSSDYTPPRTVWRTLKGKPYVIVSPVGSANGFPANNGADFGPDTPGTTTNGIAEAVNALPKVYNSFTNATVGAGRVCLLPGIYTCTDTIDIPADWSVDIEGMAIPPLAGGNFPSGQQGTGFVLINSSGPAGAIQSMDPTGTISGSSGGAIGLSNILWNCTTAPTVGEPSGKQGAGGPTFAGLDWIGLTTVRLKNVGWYVPFDLYYSVVVGNGTDDLAYMDNVMLWGTANSNILADLSAHTCAPKITVAGISNLTSTNGRSGLFIAGSGEHFYGEVHYFDFLDSLLYTYPSSALYHFDNMYLELPSTPNSLSGYYPFNINAPTVIDNMWVNPGGYNPFTYTGAPANNYASPLTIRQRNFWQGFSITTPSVPTSGTALKNPFPFPVRIYITGAGTTTAYTITDPSGNAETFSLALAAGQEITLDPGASITITYSVAPTWKWYGE